MGYVFPGLVIDIHLCKQPERQLAQPDNPQNICEGSQPHFQKMIDYNFLCSKYKQVTPSLVTVCRYSDVTSAYHALIKIGCSIACLMKGTEVPNPQRSSALVLCLEYFSPSRSEKYGLGTRLAVHVIMLTRIDHCLVTLSCSILFCSCLCKVRSRISAALSQVLCNLSLAFLAGFTLSDSTVLISFITFSCKLHSAFRLDMITAFTCLPYYRHSSFTLRAYLCWRHVCCQWPAASHAVQIHTHARFPQSIKKMANLLCSHMLYKQETL